MNATLESQDVIGQRIVEIWQSIRINDDGIDFCDNVFRLENGKQFCLPFDLGHDIEQRDIPADAQRFDDSHTKPMFASPIADLRCPSDSRFADADTSFLLLESGLWISQVTGYPTGTLATGVFHGLDNPWDPEDSPCPLASYFQIRG